MLITIVAASTLPVTVAEAVQHCRAPENGDDDALIERALRAAIDYVQNHTTLVLAPTTFQYRLDQWGCEPIKLPRAPVRDVSAITYLDADGAEQTVNASYYSWDLTPDGAAIHFADTFSAPELRARRSGTVRITFEAGYDDPAASGSGDDPNLQLPELLKICVLMLTSHWYEHREAVSFDESHPVVLAAQSILDSPGIRIYR
jgi:uncharacterized phiE125 gp8 family phage protein